jgi:hypothetical protein
MNSEHFLDFAKAFIGFKIGKQRGLPTIDYYADKQDKNAWIDYIDYALPRSKIFEISDEIKKLLALTDTPIKNDEIKLPFPYVFLDVAFTREELQELGIEINSNEIKGIMFSEGTLKDSKLGITTGKNLRITICTIQHNEEIWFDVFNKNNNLFGEYKKYNLKILENPTSDKKAKDFTHKFVLNFLNFLYNPEIEYIEVYRTEKNIERRRKQGKMAIPSSYKILLTGHLKEYVDKLQSGGHLYFNYRFWVRGFFRTLRAERYKERRGTRIWIAPFIKGSGILIDKTYLLEDRARRTTLQIQGGK